MARPRTPKRPKTQQSPQVDALPHGRPFALASRYAAETTILTIYDPAETMSLIDTGLRIEIKSVYSPEAREAILRANAALKIVDGKVDASTVDWAVNLFEQTVAITVRWWDEHGPKDGILESPDAAPTPCTEAHVRRIYADPRTGWLQKQVQAAYLDIGRFFPKPKTS